ncbi:hypothetical protein TNIN_204151, partial [Trichonephila inaurata madagascariensis]
NGSRTSGYDEMTTMLVPHSPKNFHFTPPQKVKRKLRCSAYPFTPYRHRNSWKQAHIWHSDIVHPRREDLIQFSR